MALDLSDLYMVHALGDRNNVRQRAQNIQDMYGVKPMELEEFRGKSGGFGIGKALLLGVAIAGGILGVAALASVALGSSLIFGALAFGGLATKISLASTNEKTMRTYGDYLSDFSSNAREKQNGRGHQQTMETTTDQQRSDGKQWANSLGERGARAIG